jgi:hypothetical protein
MRSSSVVGVLAVVGIAALSACSVAVTAKSKPEFVDSSQPAKTSTADWNGEAITITNDGVNPLVGAGGIQITVDPSATKITAKAIFAARGETETDAQASIRDAVATFKISEGGAFTVSCNHGGAHGTSSVGESGCKLLQVTIPSGTDAKPMNLTVANGIGDISFTGAVTASKLNIQNKSTGDAEVKVKPVKGATISVVSEFDATVSLPADFAADSVTLTGPDAGEDLVTTDFPGLESGKGFGTAGTGAASLSITAGSISTLTVKKL